MSGAEKSRWREAYYLLKDWDRYAKISDSMAIKVTRKDQSEANENIIRRFNRKVLQSGVMATAKEKSVFIYEPSDCGDVAFAVHDGELGLG